MHMPKRLLGLMLAIALLFSDRLRRTAAALPHSGTYGSANCRADRGIHRSANCGADRGTGG